MTSEASFHEENEGDAEVAEEGEEVGAALGEVAEEAAGEEPGARPEERAGHVVDDEGKVRDAELADDGGGDGAEAGDELGEEEGKGSALADGAVGALDAGGGFKREAAEKVENLAAEVLAEKVPGAVRDEAGEQDDGDRVGHVELVRGAHGAGGEHDGNAGNGEATLLDAAPSRRARSRYGGPVVQGPNASSDPFCREGEAFSIQ